jgi:hypothetical protein
MAQAVRHRHLNAEIHVQFLIRPCRIGGEQNDTETGPPSPSECFGSLPISIIPPMMHNHVRLLRTRYSRGADMSLARPTSRCILFDRENISFDASLVIYINSINILPIIILNRIYETQNLLSL